MKKILCLTLPLVFALCGCLVTSLYPFYQKGDVVFDPKLIGSWDEAESENQWEFTSSGTNEYKLTFTTKDTGVNVIEAHLFQVKGRKFLDLFGAKPDERLMPPPIATHFPLKVMELSTNSIRLAALDQGWLGEQLETQPSLVKHVVLRRSDTDDPRIVLTGGTAELQKFLLEHADTEKAWSELGLRRRAK